MLEKAFIESYRKLCDNNNDVIDEFIKRVDKVLSEDSVESKLEKAKNTDTNLRSKRSILLVFIILLILIGLEIRRMKKEDTLQIILEDKTADEKM